MTRTERELRRAELGRIARFVGAVERLEAPVSEAFYRVKIEMLPRKTERTTTKITIELPPDGIRIIESPDQTQIENVMMKLRPVFSNSTKEECSFEKIVRILPKYSVLELPALDRLESRWTATLDNRTVPILKGGQISNVLPGYDAVSTSEGRLEIGVGGAALSGREALELAIYGELEHLDQAKQRKLKEIRRTPAMDAGYRLALICLAGQLLSIARELKDYAKHVLQGLSPKERAEIED